MDGAWFIRDGKIHMTRIPIHCILVYEAREKLLSILIYDTNELTLDYLRATK